MSDTLIFMTINGQKNKQRLHDHWNMYCYYITEHFVNKSIYKKTMLTPWIWSMLVVSICHLLPVLCGRCLYIFQ
jgi:hypothetical protein